MTKAFSSPYRTSDGVHEGVVPLPTGRIDSSAAWRRAPVDWGSPASPQALSSLCSPNRPVQSEASKGVPLLHVNLFGGFEAYRDEIPLDQTCLNRRKIRMLLATLVLTGCRESNCEYVAHILWPQGSREKNRHNFYNVYSLLRSGLRLPDKSCPYLERRDSTCKLVARYTDTDVARLDQICSRLQFGEHTTAEYFQAYQELRDTYVGDLLPGEEDNLVVMRMRWEWRNRVVESLLRAAGVLLRRNEPHPAIWFLQAAASADPTREDVCRLEMEAYLSVGATAAAIQTFHEQRMYLDKAQGVPPSDTLTEFFNDILVGEETGGRPASSPGSFERAAGVDVPVFLTDEESSGIDFLAQSGWDDLPGGGGIDDNREDDPR